MNELTIIKQETQDIVSRAADMPITTQGEYEVAADFMKVVKGLQKKVTDTFDPICKAAHATWKEALAKKDEHMKPLTDAEATIKRRSIAYVQEQERKTREAQEKLRREAEAEEARKRKALEERAKKAEAQGKAEKAEELRLKAEEVKVEAPVIAPMFTKVNGQAIKDKWSAVVVDFRALPDEYKIADMPMLNRLAQASKGAMKIPGVEFKSEKVMASSAV